MAQISTKLCDSCRKQKGEVYCFNCRYVLCPLCQESHKKFPVTATHKVKYFDQTGLKNMKQYSCKDHDQHFAYFCAVCKCLVCPECPVTTHRGHTLSQLKEVSNHARDKLEARSTQIRDSITSLDERISSLKGGSIPLIRKEVENFKKSVLKIAEQLHGIIDLVCDKYITKGNDHLSLEESSLNMTLRKLENQHFQYTKVLEEMKKVLQETYDPIFLVQRQVISNMLTNLEKVPDVLSKPDRLNDISIEEFTLQFFDQMKEKQKLSIDLRQTDDRSKDVKKQTQAHTSGTISESYFPTGVYKIFVDPNLLKFVEYSSEHLPLTKDLQQLNAYIDLPTQDNNGILSICSTVTLSDTQEKALKENIDNFLQQHCTESITVSLERWRKVISGLRSISLPDPSKVVVSVQKDKQTIIISGEKQVVKILSDTTRELAA